jgi:hypothetical protein
MSVLDKIDELIEQQDFARDTGAGAAKVAKITAKAVADCQKIINKAAKKAAMASGKPEGRMKAWIEGKVKFELK